MPSMTQNVNLDQWGRAASYITLIGLTFRCPQCVPGSTIALLFNLFVLFLILVLLFVCVLIRTDEIKINDVVRSDGDVLVVLFPFFLFARFEI